MNDNDISVDDIAFLRVETLEELGKMTHGNAGYMKMYLDVCHYARKFCGKKDFICDIAMKFVGMDVVGWAIAQDLLYRHEDFLDLSIFVKQEYRGQGIASDLIKALCENRPDAKFSAWVSNDLNEGLYKNFRGPQVYAFDMKRYTKDKTYQLYSFTKTKQ